MELSFSSASSSYSYSSSSALEPASKPHPLPSRTAFAQESDNRDKNKSNPGVLPVLQRKIGNQDTINLINALTIKLKRLMIDFGDGCLSSENDMEIESNYSSSSASTINIFSGKKIPKISIDDYLGRLVYFINKDYQQDDYGIDSVGSRSLVLAYIILERFLILNRSTFVFNIKTIHRTFFAAYLIALKTNEDIQLAGDLHARAGGLQKVEMNLLVLEFCKLSNYNFIVQHDTYLQHFKSIMDT